MADNDKRKFIRLEAPIDITYRPARKQRRQPVNVSLIKNISGGGFSFVPKGDLRSGDLLSVEIQIPHLSKPIQAIAEVVWFVRPSSGSNEGREAGVRFMDIKPPDLHKILEYIHTVGIGAK